MILVKETGTGFEMGPWGLGLQSKRQNATVSQSHRKAVRCDQKFSQ